VLVLVQLAISWWWWRWTVAAAGESCTQQHSVMLNTGHGWIQTV